MVGRALACDDFVRRPPHLAGDDRLSLTGPARPAPNGHTAHPSGGPEYHLGIAMFSNDVRVDRVRINRQLTPEDVTQSRGVEHGARADDASRRQARSFGGDIGHDVHRIRHDDQQSSQRSQTRGDVSDNGGVLAQQVEATFPGAAASARGDHHSVRLDHFIEGRGPYGGCRVIGGALGEVQGLSLGQRGVEIVNEQLGRDARVQYRNRDARSDPAHADDANLHGMLVSRPSGSWHESRSAAPGWQGATTENTGRM